jgi:hypothetical protein
MPVSRRYYYWLVTRDENGRPYLVFGGNDENEARRKGLEILDGMDFEIKRYPTRDLTAASSYFRGKRLEDTHSIKESSRRIGHDKSIDRIRKKREKRNPLGGF